MDKTLGGYCPNCLNTSCNCKPEFEVIEEVSDKEYERAKDFILAEIKKNMDKFGKMSSKWVFVMAEIMARYVKPDWKKRENMPEYDGSYLCFCEQPQECGNVWKYQKVIECQFNEWVEQEPNEVVKILDAITRASSETLNYLLWPI